LQVLDRIVRTGEEVTITKRGKAVARVVRAEVQVTLDEAREAGIRLGVAITSLLSLNRRVNSPL